MNSDRAGETSTRFISLQSHPQSYVIFNIWPLKNKGGPAGQHLLSNLSYICLLKTETIKLQELCFCLCSFLSSMATFSATLLKSSFPCFSPLPQTLRRSHLYIPSIRAVKSTEPEKEKATKTEEPSTNAQPSTPTAAAKPKKPIYSSGFLSFTLKKIIQF